MNKLENKYLEKPVLNRFDYKIKQIRQHDGYCVRGWRMTDENKKIVIESANMNFLMEMKKLTEK